ncbi:MAG: FixG Ig-like domain-containing protein [Rhodanobacteraceae bacterium]
MISKFSLALGVAAVLGLSAMVPNNDASFIAGASARTLEKNALQPVPRSGQQTRPGLPFGTDFFENWDSYVVGSNVHGQGGWKGWANDPNAGAFVDDAFSVSPTNSINIEGPSDLIHEFSGYTSGFVTVSAKMYIPGDFSGDTYFIFENVYSDVDTSVISWSTQVIFRGASGTVENFDGAANPGSLPFVTDEWADLRLEIDLDADVQTFYYNDQMLYTGSWTDQFPDQGVPGILNIGSVDLFAGAPTLSTPVYYDDFSIVAGVPSDFGVEFGSASDALSGAPGDSVVYTVTLNNTGTVADTYDIAVTAAWTSTPSITTISIPAGQSDVFNVTVEIPPGAISGDSDIATVTATSQGDPNVTATTELTTTAEVSDTIFQDGFENPT